MTHQELDDIFRANSERGEFAPQPGEWEEMTAMLDEDERRERYARWVSIGWMSLFVLLIGAGIYGLSTFSASSDKDAPRLIATLTTASGGGQVYTPSADGNTDLKEQANPTSYTADYPMNTVSQRTDVDALVAPGQQLSSANPAAAAIEVEQLNEGRSNIASFNSSIETSRIRSTQGSDNQSVMNAALSALSVSNSEASASKRSVSMLTRDELGSASQPALVAAEPSVKDSSTDLEKQVFDDLTDGDGNLSMTALPSMRLVLLGYNSTSVEEDTDFNVPPVVLAEAQSWSRFSGGLFVAEELTSVAMSKEVRLGTRIGAQLHYNPLRQWSLDLGISYAHKSYMAPDGEMQNTLGLFIDDVLPVQTDGECDILEVPLTVTFLPRGHGQAGPFVSAGVLSYRIFREQMVFHYDEPTSQVGDATAPDMGSLFGSAHFQVGYRFVPNRGPAFRIGPYVHVPMTMVGSGKLPLYSGGLQLEVELF